MPNCEEHPGPHCLPEGWVNTSFAQKCEAANLLMDGNTYIYNEGRKVDEATGRETPGICNLSGCWCCVREQRPLPLGDFYRDVPIAPVTTRDSVAPSPASVEPSPNFVLPSPEAWRDTKCSFDERFGNFSVDAWRKYRPDFLLGREHMRAQLGVPKGFRTCAVVGSSGKLLHGLHGNVIDDHEMVMRMNTAPTVGYQIYTGGRTTHRMEATTGFEKMLTEHHCKEDGRKCLVNSHAPPWCPVGALILNSFLVDQHKDARTHPMYIQFMRACGSLVPRDSPMGEHARTIAHQALTTKNSHFMTGLAGLLVAAMLCDDGFDVYGFDTGDEPPDTQYHFYDTVQPSEKDDFDASKAFYKAFVEAQPYCIRNHD